MNNSSVEGNHSGVQNPTRTFAFFRLLLPVTKTKILSSALPYPLQPKNNEVYRKGDCHETPHWILLYNKLFNARKNPIYSQYGQTDKAVNYEGNNLLMRAFNGDFLDYFQNKGENIAKQAKVFDCVGAIKAILELKCLLLELMRVHLHSFNFLLIIMIDLGVPVELFRIFTVKLLYLFFHHREEGVGSGRQFFYFLLLLPNFLVKILNFTLPSMRLHR